MGGPPPLQFTNEGNFIRGNLSKVLTAIAAAAPLYF